MENPRTHLSRKEFDRYNVYYPSNMVIVEMPPEKDILVGGIKINFNEDVQYAEGSDNHIANCAKTHGTIVKQVEKLYYNRKDVTKSMSWRTSLETRIGDTVFFHHLASTNCCEIEVEGTLYKIINYEDLLVAKGIRTHIAPNWNGSKGTHEESTVKIIPLNGNVILEEVYKPKLSWLDVSTPEVDKYRGIVRWNGSENEEYQSSRGVADMKGLKEGDLVLIDPNSYPFYLERSKYNSSFDQGKQYLTSQKRYIQAVI